MQDTPYWRVDRGFVWIFRDTSTRCLGFQVGINVSHMHQFALVLLSTPRKLAHWSIAKLSLAGRALVLNKVVLATMW